MLGGDGGRAPGAADLLVVPHGKEERAARSKHSLRQVALYGGELRHDVVLVVDGATPPHHACKEMHSSNRQKTDTQTIKL